MYRLAITGGKWGAHCYSLYFSIEMFSKLKVGDFNAELFPPIVALYKLCSLKFCTTDEDLWIETSCIR